MSILERLVGRLAPRETWRRVRTLPGPWRALVVASGLMVGLLAVMLIWPGAIPLSAPESAAPWVVITVAAAIVSTTAAGGFALSVRGVTGGALVGLVTAMPLFAVLCLWMFGAYVFAGASLCALSVVATVERLDTRAPLRWAPAIAALSALLSALPWLLLLTYALSASRPDAALLWDVLTDLGAIVVFASGSVIVAAGVMNRPQRVVGWLSRHATVRLVLAVLAVKVAVVVLRFTVLNDLFGPTDAFQWRLRGLPSWPHAVVVALVVLAVVVRSGSVPLRSSGHPYVIVALMVGAASAPVSAFIDLVATMLATGAHGSLVRVEWLFDRHHWLAVVAGVSVAPAVLLARCAGTTAAAVGLVALVYLAPPVLAIALESEGLKLPTVWASPVQIDISLTAAVVVALALSAVKRKDVIRPDLAVRLIAVPTIALHAAGLVPAVIEDAAGRYLVVAGALVALLAISPAMSTAAVLGLMSVELGALLMYILGLADSEGVDRAEMLLQLLWLAIPLGTLLMVRLQAEEPG